MHEMTMPIQVLEFSNVVTSNFIELQRPDQLMTNTQLDPITVFPCEIDQVPIVNES